MEEIEKIYNFMGEKIDNMSLEDLREFAKHEYWNTIVNLSEEELETEKQAIGFND